MDDLDRSKSALAASLTPLAAGQVIAAPAAADVQGDTITGSGGPDLIVGGPGPDLVYAMGGQASVDGGAGVDTLSFEQFAWPVTAHFADGAATGLAFVSRFEIVVGSALGDTLVGGGGMLTISGGAGADLLTAAADTRQINGDDGADTLQGLNVTVTLFGGDGDDRITGGTGSTRSTATRATTRSRQFAGRRLAAGRPGQRPDQRRRSSGHNIINGNIGGDMLVGGAGGDTLRGGQGDDLIHGGSGADIDLRRPGGQHHHRRPGPTPSRQAWPAT